MSTPATGLDRLLAHVAELARARTASHAALVTCEAACEVSGAARAVLGLTDHARGVIRLVHFRGLEPNLRVSHYPLEGHAPMTVAMRERRAIYVADFATLEREYPEAAAAHRERPERASRAYAALPLISDEQVIGSLLLGFESDGGLSNREERSVLEALAAQCALALERVISEEAERRARDELESLIGALPAGVALFDREGRYRRMNAALAEMNRFSIEEHLGKKPGEILPELAPVEAILERVMASRAPSPPLEMTHVGEDGSVRRFGARLVPVISGGEAVGVVGIVEDMTRRKRNEQHLALMAALGRTIAETLGTAELLPAIARALVPAAARGVTIHLRGEMGMLELRASAHVDAAIDAAQREILARWPEAAAKLTASRVIESGEPELDTMVDEHLLRAAALDDEHLAALRGLGVRSALAVPLTARGRTFGAIALASDGVAHRYDEIELALAREIATAIALALDHGRVLDEARAARARAEAANADKDRFLSTIAHEIRNPLGAMLGWAQVARSPGAQESVVQQALETIERNAQVQRRLVDDLLDYARTAGGRVVLDRHRIAIATIAELALESARPMAARARARLVLEEDRAWLSHVHGDAERLQQVMGNLLANAIKFAPGGTVILRATNETGRVRIDVIDDGAGISPEMLPHVFEPFRSGDPRAGARSAGLGIGLALVREIVMLHGGQVHASSGGLGRGSTISLWFPLA